jgi:hypothetical protein
MDISPKSYTHLCARISHVTHQKRIRETLNQALLRCHAILLCFFKDSQGSEHVCVLKDHNNYHIHTVHLVTINVLLLTDAQLN